MRTSCMVQSTGPRRIKTTREKLRILGAGATAPCLICKVSSSATNTQRLIKRSLPSLVSPWTQTHGSRSGPPQGHFFFQEEKPPWTNNSCSQVVSTDTDVACPRQSCCTLVDVLMKCGRSLAAKRWSRPHEVVWQPCFTLVDVLMKCSRSLEAKLWSRPHEVAMSAK